MNPPSPDYDVELRLLIGDPASGPSGRPRKEQAPCCLLQVDELGRPPIGYCSPTCVRRPR